MRVLLVGPELLMPWTAYTAQALRRLGQKVRVFHETHLFLDRLTLQTGRRVVSCIPGLVRPMDRWRADWCQRRDERLLQEAKSWQPDLIFVLWGKSWSARLLQRLKSEVRCRLVTWWTDDPFRNPTENIFPLYDTFFVFDRSYMAPLRQAGVQDVRFLPCACDEAIFFPQAVGGSARRRYQSQLALIAWYTPERYTPDRLETLRALAQFQLKIWGRGWKSSGGSKPFKAAAQHVFQRERFIPDYEAALIYNATEIGLNVHSVQTHEAGLNTRSFELLAAGAFELMDAVPGMEELLQPDREVVVYRSPEEAVSLARYYLQHPQQRKTIARQGRQKTLTQHTYRHRMRQLLECAN